MFLLNLYFVSPTCTASDRCYHRQEALLEQQRNGRSTVLPSSPNYDLLGGKEKTLTKETRSNYEGGANGKYNYHSSKKF